LICLKLLSLGLRALENLRSLNPSPVSSFLGPQAPVHGTLLICPPPKESLFHVLDSCPLECRLSRSDKPWQCIVSLRFITDADGQPLGQARNEQFGDIIFDKDDIEDRIRRAQFAILNPKTSAKKFLAGDADKRPLQLSFSLNAITLQISGPDVADLSFCDLPGALVVPFIDIDMGHFHIFKKA
jgi:hypothetical protein